MEHIVDVTGDEAKMAMIQFLGQNMPELRQLDGFIVNKATSLQGFAIDAQAIVDKIPGGRPPGIFPQPSPVVQQIIIEQPREMVSPAQCTVVPNLPDLPDDQLEFNFKYDVIKDIANQLDRLNDRLGKIEVILIAIETRIGETKPADLQKKT